MNSIHDMGAAMVWVKISREQNEPFFHERGKLGYLLASSQ